MSFSKIITAVAMTIAIVLPNKAQALNLSNGLAAGKALLSLYTQYKTDGKIDLSNPTNLASIASLATNIKGLNAKTENTDFISGLISGSKNLVSDQNSSSVISTLTSVAGLDLKSLSSAAAGNAASGLLSKLGGSKTSTTADNATLKAAGLLSSLFAGL